MMDIIKKNVVSISCGVIALLAIVVVFVWPMPGWYNALQARLDDSRKDYTAIKDLNSKVFYQPKVDPTKSEAQPLGQFPNEATLKGLEIVEKAKGQTAAMEKMTRAMNEHRPLVPNALPIKRGTGFYDFKLEYYRMLNEFKAAMNAVAAPTPEEIKAEEERLWKDEFEQHIQKVAGAEPNRPQVEADYQRRLLRLPDEMKKDRAKRYTVFLTDNKTLDACPGIMPAQEGTDFPTDPVVVWATQLTLWIQEDIVRAIVETNAKVTNPTVETAIVKRLAAWDIPKRYITKKGEVSLVESAGQQAAPGRPLGRPTRALPPALAAQADPSAPTEEEAGPGTKEFAVSATGRVCNSMYDVVHFTVVVDADATRFREFIKQLTDNRLITILSVDMIGVDRDREQWRGFLYGPNPVVRLRLNCEAIFLRSWTLPLMPLQVQKLIGIPQKTEATGGV